MRTVVYRSLYKRDFKREYRGQYRWLLDKGGELAQISNMLERDIALPPRYRDHPLHGKHDGSRECHIRPDLLLVYRLEGDDLLILERLGSHAEIFGM